MNRKMIRILCAALVLMLAACAVALAATETKTYKTYTPLDAQFHTVTEETWVYPIINGSAGSGNPQGDNKLGSGKPNGSNTYTEPHTFVDGVCTLCGYKAETFTNAMGVVLTKGMPAAEVLKLVVDAMPEDSDISFVEVPAEAGDAVMELVKNAAAPEEYIPALAAFPAETVDGTPSNVVTLAYNDLSGNAVTENYAFSTADTTLVKLY